MGETASRRARLLIVGVSLAFSVQACWWDCNSERCESSELMVPALGEDDAGEVSFTLASEGTDESVICSWEVLGAQAGAEGGTVGVGGGAASDLLPQAHWVCTPEMTNEARTELSFDEALTRIENESYLLTVEGPRGRESTRIRQTRAGPGDGCGCTARYFFPSEVFEQAGARIAASPAR